LREIGVRKTLGAKSRQILLLLLIDLARPVVIANLIAWPFAYVAARAYVSPFLTPLHISPLLFLYSLLATVTVACLVGGGQALRAARSQPADVLRYE
jgi:putative ABC transport system permease protein